MALASLKLTDLARSSTVSLQLLMHLLHADHPLRDQLPSYRLFITVKMVRCNKDGKV